MYTVMSMATNYLIITFDGIGDGIIYYPIFQEVGRRVPQSNFFYTTNLLLQDDNVINKIKLPSNFYTADDSFRTFRKKQWGAIYNFLIKNEIKVIINLRFIGRRFEKNYFDFKEWVSLKNNDIIFFDDESLRDSERVNLNVRDIIRFISEKALKIKLNPNMHTFRDVLKRNKQSKSIFINVHSRGTFKLWEISKWASLISNLALLYKDIEIYNGFNYSEKRYTEDILKNLDPSIRDTVKIIGPFNLDRFTEVLGDTGLLISVDSGLVHLADSIGTDSLGLYIMTSPEMWGGVTDKFHYVRSEHMSKCRNFYPYFGMCMHNKIKCVSVIDGKDDISVPDVLNKVKQIFYEKN